MSASPDVGRIGEIGQDFGRLIGSGALSPEDEAALGALIELSGRLAATIAAQEAQIAVLTARIARMQRDLHGSRPEKRGSDNPEREEGSAAGSKRPGGKPGRKKARADAVGDTGLRFNGQAPVIDITVTPPEIEGLAGDEYEVVAERVCCKPATLAAGTW